MSVSPLYGVRHRLTPSHGAACEPWPWPWTALLAPSLPVTAWAAALILATPCDNNVAVAVWALSARIEPPGWRPFGCGATK